MKLLYRFLDKYFSKKVIYLITNHFEDRFSVFSQFDDAFEKYYIYGVCDIRNEQYTVDIFSFKRETAFIEIINLLNNGWTPLDNNVNEQINKIVWRLNENRNLAGN